MRTGRGYSRLMKQRELLVDGILNHPWFHLLKCENILEDCRKYPCPNIHYYVFLDLETCGDKNYQNHLNPTANIDQIGKQNRRGTLGCHIVIQQALQHPIFSTSRSKLIIFDCQGRVRLNLK